MKNILVTAGGTATAWHICSVVNEFLGDEIRVIVADINPPQLVPCTILADKVVQVPYSDDPDYVDSIERVIINEKIDIIIPLIPREAFFFHPEAKVVREHGVFTTIPPIDTVKTLADKKNLYEFLVDLSISTPPLIKIDNIEDEKLYIIKPRLGFGSVGVTTLSGAEIKQMFSKVGCADSNVIQEYCKADDYDEVTVEVFNTTDRLEIFARRRVDVKSGVCVKMEPYSIEPFEDVIKQIVESIVCPIAFNVQFLRDKGQWKLFDLNLRLPAGTALSTAIGFQLTRALLTVGIGKTVPKSFFSVDESVHYVLRTYQEHLIR